jgi:phosphoglycerate kinase
MLFQKLTIKDIPLEGKTVLLRADYNVPLDDNGKIDDDYRIKQSLPTLHYLLEQNCKIVICSHLGRPKGEKDHKLSLEPIAQHLADLISRPVSFVPDCVGDKVEQAVKRLHPGNLVLLENLRFYLEEKENQPEFARNLAKSSQANYLIQDGFGVVHRAHASTDAITRVLPSVAGLLLEKEYINLSAVREKPQRPLVAVMGGAKVTDKVDMVEEFISIADKIVIGGAMANNFLKFLGYPVGKSKLEPEAESEVKKIITAFCKDSHDHKQCMWDNSKFMLPIDAAVAKSLENGEKRQNKLLKEVEEDDYILDIGDKSIERMIEMLSDTKTVLWNGTMGLAEHESFAHGSARLALFLAQNKNKIRSVIGGGDTADFALNWDGAHGGSFTHVSTGGGASLELLAGKKLPGVEALLDKN